MKYLVFTAVLLSVPLAAAILAMDRRLLRAAMAAMLLPLLCFSATSINFFSHELYRGTSRGMEVSLIYLIAVAALLAMLYLRGLRTPLPTAGTVLYLGYFLLSLPSLATAESILFAFFELWKMAMVYLVYLATYRYLDSSGGDFRPFIAAFAVITAFVFASAVMQHFAGVYQVRAQFPHQNSMAMFMLPLATIFLSFFLNRRGLIRPWLALGLFILASGALLRSYSRGAIACFPLGCAVTAGVSLLHDWKARKFQSLAVMALSAALIGLAFAPRLIERFASAPESSGQTRRNFAIAAINMIRDEPLLGVGINNWGIKINPPYEYSRHRDPRRGFTEDYKDGIVETIYLLVAAECGLPCLLALLALFGYYWCAAWRLLGKLRRTPYFYIPAGIIGGLTGIYLQSLLEWVLKQQVNFLELVVLFAFLDYLSRNARTLRQRSHDNPYAEELHA